MNVTVTVNGQERSAEVEPRLLLVHFLRGKLGLTGTHVGCDTTSCGACTVLLDGTPVKSCTMFAVQAEGRELTTVEGLGTASELDPVQEGFSVEHGLQCGFCTPGMMLSARRPGRPASCRTSPACRRRARCTRRSWWCRSRGGCR